MSESASMIRVDIREAIVINHGGSVILDISA